MTPEHRLTGQTPQPRPRTVTHEECQETLAMRSCPYYQGDGVCSNLGVCLHEPRSCQVNEPQDGWDAVVAAWTCGQRA